MELIIYFCGLRTFFNERLDFLQLAFIPSLEPRRIMENELWVAGKGEWTIDVVDPALITTRLNSHSASENAVITPEVGSNWFAGGRLEEALLQLSKKRTKLLFFSS